MNKVETLYLYDQKDFDTKLAGLKVVVEKELKFPVAVIAVYDKVDEISVQLHPVNLREEFENYSKYTRKRYHAVQRRKRRAEYNRRKEQEQ